MENKQSYKEALADAMARLTWEQVADTTRGGKRTGNYIKAQCHMKAHADNKPSCCYYDDGHFKCYSCGAYGSMASYVAETLGLGWGAALKHLQDMAGTGAQGSAPRKRVRQHSQAVASAGRRKEGLRLWFAADDEKTADSPLTQYLRGRVPASARSEYFYPKEQGRVTYTSGYIRYIPEAEAKKQMDGWWFGDSAGLAVCGYTTPEGELVSAEICGLRADGRRFRGADGSVVKNFMGGRPPGSACPVWRNSGGHVLIVTEGPWNAWAVPILSERRGIDWGDVRCVMAAGSASNLKHLSNHLGVWADKFRSIQRVILIPDPDASGNRTRRAFGELADVWDLPGGMDVIDYINSAVESV